MPALTDAHPPCSHINAAIASAGYEVNRSADNRPRPDPLSGRGRCQNDRHPIVREGRGQLSDTSPAAARAARRTLRLDYPEVPDSNKLLENVRYSTGPG